jgi:hypothetical protein
MRWAELVAYMGERSMYEIVVSKPEENRQLGKPRRR